LTLAGLAPREPAAKPLPESGILRVPVEVVRTTFPVALPLAWGANATVKVALCPADTVSGKVRAETLNPVPEATAWEMMALDPPELVRVAVWLCVVPTGTFPKLRALGVAEICPGVVPFPETVTTALVGVDSAFDS